MDSILITGINSKLAGPILENLKNKYKVYGLCRDKNNIKNIVNNVVYLECDLLNEIKIDFEIDYIMHLAAYIPYNKKIDNFKYSCLNNIYMMNNLLKLAIEQKIKKIIFASSIDVYGKTYSNNITEETNCMPSNYYGLGKRACEDLLNVFYNCYKLNFSAFRISYVLGLDIDKDRFLKKMLTSIKSHQEIDLYNPSNILNMIHVEEIAKVFSKALEGPNGVYNLSKSVKLSSMVECAKSVYRSNSKISYTYKEELLEKKEYNNQKLINFFGSDYFFDLDNTVLGTVKK